MTAAAKNKGRAGRPKSVVHRTAPSAPRASAWCRSAARRRWSTPSASSPSCGRRATSSRPTTPAPTWCWSTPAGSWTRPRQESLDAIGEAMAENGRVIVTGCFGVEEDRIRAAHPGVLAVTGPHQYEQVVAAVHAAVPPLHDPFLDLVPPEGLRAHPAPLRVSEDFRGLQQPLLVLHHPAAARQAREPPGQPRDGRGRAAGEGRREGAAGHQPGHLRLRPRHQVRREPLEGPAAAGALPRPVRGAGLARRLGAAALRLSLPARRSPCCR